MTMPHLWYPGCQVVESPANPWAPYTLKASGVFDSASFGSPQSITLPSSYSTATNDCIIVAYSLSGSTSPTISGCGATWLSAAGAIDGNTNPRAGFNFGYAATAGGTSISMAGIGTAHGTVIIAVFADLKAVSTPLGSGWLGSNAGGALTFTASTTTVAQQLVLSSGGTNTTGSWSAGSPSTFGGTNLTNIQIDNNQQATRLDGLVVVTGQTNPSCVFHPSNGSNIEGTILIMNHA